MKIGLIRHFKVTRGYPASYVTSDELMKWVEEYDISGVESNTVDLKDIEWKSCYSSDLSRAQITAETVYEGEITFLKELREIKLSPIFRSDRKLPLFLHLAFIRLAWWFNHRSQPESKREIEERIRAVVDRVVQEGKDVLIVGHGGNHDIYEKRITKAGIYWTVVQETLQREVVCISRPDRVITCPIGTIIQKGNRKWKKFIH